MESAFNSERTLEAIQPMRRHQQLACTAACCERMLPNYSRFSTEVGWGDIAPLRLALDSVWGMCEDGSEPVSDLRLLLLQCEECAPDADSFCSPIATAAEEATFAVCALLEFVLTNDVAHLVSVPRYSTDTVDLIVQEREAMDTRDPSRETRILGHPLMQQELRRQARDLADARRLRAADIVALREYRSRASGEANLVFADVPDGFGSPRPNG